MIIKSFSYKALFHEIFWFNVIVSCRHALCSEVEQRNSCGNRAHYFHHFIWNLRSIHSNSLFKAIIKFGAVVFGKRGFCAIWILAAWEFTEGISGGFFFSLTCLFFPVWICMSVQECLSSKFFKQKFWTFQLTDGVCNRPSNRSCTWGHGWLMRLPWQMSRRSRTKPRCYLVQSCWYVTISSQWHFLYLFCTKTCTLSVFPPCRL